MPWLVRRMGIPTLLTGMGWVHPCIHKIRAIPQKSKGQEGSVLAWFIREVILELLQDERTVARGWARLSSSLSIVGHCIAMRNWGLLLTFFQF